ncbi:Lrp/AsnC family transcriptional regulator [Spirochaetota bacterium]
MTKIDEANLAIIRILQKDSSITNQDLASRIGLSPASTLERVKKMEQAGVIKRYVALVDMPKVDLHIKAFVSITMKDHSNVGIQAFSERIREFPEVLECCRLAGEKDYIIKVVCENIEAFDEFTRTKLASLPGIDKTSSNIVLSSMVDRTELPV